MSACQHVACQHVGVVLVVAERYQLLEYRARAMKRHCGGGWTDVNRHNVPYGNVLGPAFKGDAVSNITSEQRYQHLNKNEGEYCRDHEWSDNHCTVARHHAPQPGQLDGAPQLQFPPLPLQHVIPKACARAQ